MTSQRLEYMQGKYAEVKTVACTVLNAFLTADDLGEAGDDVEVAAAGRLQALNDHVVRLVCRWFDLIWRGAGGAEG